MYIIIYICIHTSIPIYDHFGGTIPIASQHLWVRSASEAHHNFQLVGGFFNPLKNMSERQLG